MPGAPQGGGAKFLFSLLLEIRRSNLNTKISISIKEIQKKYFLPGASQGGGTKSLFSLLLEIGRPNLNTKISISIKEIKKKKNCQGRPRGGGKIFIFVIIRDRTFKLRYQYFHIYLRSSKKIFFAWGGGKFLFSLLLEIGPSNLNINISILI